MGTGVSEYQRAINGLRIQNDEKDYYLMSQLAI